MLRIRLNIQEGEPTIGTGLCAKQFLHFSDLSWRCVLFMFGPSGESSSHHIEQISSKEKKTIVVFGSLYLIGDVLNKN